MEHSIKLTTAKSQSYLNRRQYEYSMREDETTCNWCWSVNTGDTLEWIPLEDPSAALGLPKMASQDAAARDRSQERSHVAYARAAEPDAGIPAHVALTKQLHSGTGYNLVIDTEGKVYGTREPYNKEAIMEVTARVPGEVQIRAKQSKFYLAMDERGKIYAEEDEESPNIWFKEIYEDGWNYYIWLGNNKQWFLGINKNGKMKHGPKTKQKQKSVKFVPRSATPTYN